MQLGIHPWSFLPVRAICAVSHLCHFVRASPSFLLQPHHGSQAAGSITVQMRACFVIGEDQGLLGLPWAGVSGAYYSFLTQRCHRRHRLSPFRENGCPSHRLGKTTAWWECLAWTETVVHVHSSSGTATGECADKRFSFFQPQPRVFQTRWGVWGERPAGVRRPWLDPDPSPDSAGRG